jgi:hypothetical protein
VRGAGGRHRAGLDDAADVLGAPGREHRQIARIVSGAADREPDQAARRGEHEIAPGEPEQVICSCRVHGGRHEGAAVDETHPARRQPSRSIDSARG